MTTQFSLMIERMRLELADINESKKKQIKGQAYTETSLMRIIVAMDQLISLSGNVPEGFEVVKTFTNPSNL